MYVGFSVLWTGRPQKFTPFGSSATSGVYKGESDDDGDDDDDDDDDDVGDGDGDSNNDANNNQLVI